MGTREQKMGGRLAVLMCRSQWLHISISDLGGISNKMLGFEARRMFGRRSGEGKIRSECCHLAVVWRVPLSSLEFAVEDIFKPLKFLHHQDPQGEGVAKMVISKSSETRSSSVQEAG